MVDEIIKRAKENNPGFDPAAANLNRDDILETLDFSGQSVAKSQALVERRFQRATEEYSADRAFQRQLDTHYGGNRKGYEADLNALRQVNDPGFKDWMTKVGAKNAHDLPPDEARKWSRELGLNKGADASAMAAPEMKDVNGIQQSQHIFQANFNGKDGKIETVTFDAANMKAAYKLYNQQDGNGAPLRQNKEVRDAFLKAAAREEQLQKAGHIPEFS